MELVIGLAYGAVGYMLTSSGFPLPPVLASVLVGYLLTVMVIRYSGET